MLILTLFLACLLSGVTGQLDVPVSCPPVTPLSASDVCGTDRVCYQERPNQDLQVSIAFSNLCESSQCPVSQLTPVLARPGDSISLLFSEEPFFKLPSGLSVYSFSTQQSFIACDDGAYNELVVSGSDVLNASISSESLSPGINYLSFSTDISCIYLRMVVNVQNLDCTAPGSDLVCGGVGVCAAPTDPFSETGYVCVCPVSDGASYKDRYCSDLNECSSSPCMNGGNCSELEECGYTCECAPGYIGARCEFIDACFPNPCANNSQCIIVNSTNFRCICPLGLTGETCNERVNNCVPYPCQNQGICMNLVDGYDCNCLVGFTGSRCESRIDYCNHSLCMGGDCANVTGGYTCICPPDGRQNSTCACYAGLCENGGECNDTGGYAVCRCPTGFSGVRCEVDRNLCETQNPCSQFGSCVETSNGQSTLCICQPTHTGPNCSTPIDPCFGITCNSRGTCTPRGDSYTCVCEAGFSGDNCEVSDPCSSSPCANDSTCVNATNSNTGDDFQCICPVGVSGRTCDTLISCDSAPCNNGTCITVSDTGVIECVCPLGAYGFYCELELDILTPRFKRTQSYLGYPAPSLGAKSQLRIRFRTSSPDGIILFSSLSPTQVGDYILVQLSGGLVSSGVDCGSGGTSAQISAQPLNDDTYHILDVTLDSCTVEISVDNQHSAVSTTPGESYVINLSGMLYLGRVPETVSLPPAAERRGMVGCVSAVEVDNVSISLGSPESGMNVENCDVNVCQGVQCANGGRCIQSNNTGTGYSCICPDGSELSSCGLPACLSNPCMHGGQCLLQGGQAVCVCQPFFTGALCENKANVTTPFFSGSQQSYIKHGLRPQQLVYLSMRVRPSANFLSGVLAYTSEREDGLGDYLLLALSAGFPVLQWDLGSGQGLLSSPVQLAANAWYQIIVRRSGITATIRVDDNPAVSGNSSGFLSVLNSGSSLYLGGVPSLTFISPLALALGINGFTGCISEFEVYSEGMRTMLIKAGVSESGSGVSECETDPCVPNVCQNGGGCVSVMGGTSCVCLPGYTGAYCGSLLQKEDCSSQVCADAATCVLLSSGTQCLCPLGKTGDRCGQDIMITYPSFTKSPFAYLQYSVGGLSMTTDISLSFYTQSRYGILLYTSQRGGEVAGDFLSLAVFDGKLELRWNLGSGNGQLQSSQVLSFSEWYQVEVKRTARRGELNVFLLSSDTQTPVGIIGYSQGSLASLNTNGLVYVGGADSYVRTAASSGVAAGLNGCIRDLVINGRSYSHDQANTGVDVESCSPHPCISHSCATGGTCQPSDDFSSYNCSCSIPYTGDLCDESVAFENASFSGDSYAAYVFYGNPVTTEIEFSLRLIQGDGLVMWVGREQGSGRRDYLEVGVRGGRIQGSLDVGSGNASWVLDTDVSDGMWHRFRLVHQMKQLNVSVDSERQELVLPGDSELFNPSGGMWVGGHRDLEMTGYSLGFRGCVGRLVVSGRTVDLDNPTEVLLSRNVISCDS